MGTRSVFLRGFFRSEDGAVAIVGAASAFVVVILAAMAVDVGSMVLHARQVQGAADLAALSAARDLPRAGLAAASTARANLGDNIVVRTEVGVWVGDPREKPADRFTVTQASPNGARVEITSPARLYFAALLGKSSVNVTRRATAAIPGAEPTALFTVGSRLLGLDRGLLNALLNGLTGSNLNLSVMDYTRLVGAEVNLLGFLDALAVDLGLEVGDYDSLLRHEVTTGQVLGILEAVASEDARSILSVIASQPLTTRMKVSDIVNVGADVGDGLRRGLDVDVSALDLLLATLETGNGGRHLALDTNLNLGVADVTLRAAIGERPNESSWVTLSSTGEPVLYTAQTRIYARVATRNFIPELMRMELDVFAEAASAEARIRDIQCTAQPRVLVDARPGLLRVSVGKVVNPGDIDDFTRPVRTEKQTIAVVLLIPVRVFANLESKDRSWQQLSFNMADIEQRTFKKVRAREISTTLLNSLTRELDLEIGLLGLGWVVNLLTPLTTLLGWVLDMVLNPVLSMLGVGLGEADVAVYGINCPGGRRGVPNLVG